MSTEGRPLTVTEAAAYTGLSRSTMQRRGDLWLSGERSPKAVKCGRTHGSAGERRFDPVDLERVRLQLLGELAGEVTADEYAAGQASG